MSIVVTKGGKGSGHKGHKGRIGKRGGSIPDDVNSEKPPEKSTPKDIVFSILNNTSSVSVPTPYSPGAYPQQLDPIQKKMMLAFELSAGDMDHEEMLLITPDGKVEYIVGSKDKVYIPDEVNCQDGVLSHNHPTDASINNVHMPLSPTDIACAAKLGMQEIRNISVESDGVYVYRAYRKGNSDWLNEYASSETTGSDTKLFVDGEEITFEGNEQKFRFVMQRFRFAKEEFFKTVAFKYQNASNGAFSAAALNYMNKYVAAELGYVYEKVRIK